MNAIINLVIPGADRSHEDARFDEIGSSIGTEIVELNISTRQRRGRVSSCSAYDARGFAIEAESAKITEIVRAHYPNAIW